MEQKLAEPKKIELRTNTQQYFIQELWRKIPKTDFNKEKDKDRKVALKGELYTKISQMYQEKYGRPVKRSTIRRCVNSLINKAN